MYTVNTTYVGPTIFYVGSDVDRVVWLGQGRARLDLMIIDLLSGSRI